MEQAAEKPTEKTNKAPARSKRKKDPVGVVFDLAKLRKDTFFARFCDILPIAEYLVVEEPGITGQEIINICHEYAHYLHGKTTEKKAAAQALLLSCPNVRRETIAAVLNKKRRDR